MNITDILLLQKEHKLHVIFADGSKISFPCSYLRAHSPSAEVNQRENPKINIDAIEPIGNYALKLHFDDGHQSGIYTFEYLYELMHKFKKTKVVIGLIGGIAMGKTTAAQFFKDAGIKVIDTDHIARDLTASGPILDHITEHFGLGILSLDGTLNRPYLRKIIFEDHEERKWLEALLHPLIRREAELEALDAPGPYCIVAIPLLKQREDYPFLQKIIAIITPNDTQIRRLMARDRISEVEAQAIIATQPSVEDFTRIADIVIDNNGTEVQLITKLQEVYERLACENRKRASSAP